MISIRDYRDCMKEILRERDKFDNEIDLYFSLINHVIIQKNSKNFIMNSDTIDPNLIIY